MILRRLLTTALVPTAALAALTACGTVPQLPEEGEGSHADVAALVSAVAEASGRDAFSQVDVVGTMVTLTYLDDKTVMNGAGDKPGMFEYQVFDDYQDTRRPTPLAQLPIDRFVQRLDEQRGECGGKEVVGRLTVTATGAVLEQVGCETGTTRPEIASTWLDDKPVGTLASLTDAAGLDALLAEARTLHGNELASLTLTTGKAEGSEAEATTVAMPKPNPAGTPCAQTAHRWPEAGEKAGLRLQYADCSPTPVTGPALDVSATSGEQVAAAIGRAAQRLGVAPADVEQVVLAGGKGGAAEVTAQVGQQQATVTL